MPARSPEEIHASLAATFNERDLDAYARHYEENAAMILPPEGNRASGRDAIRAAVEATFELRPSLQIEVVETLQADGLALTHARWSLTGTDAGERVGLSGRGTLVSRRQPDGSWRIVLENAMTP